MTPESGHELISVKEAAKICSRNTETIRRWIWNGKLPAEKLGNQLFIKKRDLDIYCRETAIEPYRSTKKQDFLERAIALQNRIKARGGELTNSAEIIRKMREERIDELI